MLTVAFPPGVPDSNVTSEPVVCASTVSPFAPTGAFSSNGSPPLLSVSVRLPAPDTATSNSSVPDAASNVWLVFDSVTGSPTV